MILAIDFDNVIHDTKNVLPGRKMGIPVSKADVSLRLFRQKGYRIILFTTWGDEKRKKVIADWMNFFKIPFDEITNIKPEADYYIDDKAIKFEGWHKINL